MPNKLRLNLQLSFLKLEGCDERVAESTNYTIRNIGEKTTSSISYSTKPFGKSEGSAKVGKSSFRYEKCCPACICDFGNSCAS